jgi:hypothetical protein
VEWPSPAEKNGSDAAGHYPNPHRETSAATCGNEDTGGDAGGGPEYGCARGFRPTSQPKPRRRKIRYTDGPGRNERCDPRLPSAAGKHQIAFKTVNYATHFQSPPVRVTTEE